MRVLSVPRAVAAAAFLFSAALVFPGLLFAQGSLTPPPGTPAPTFKTLQQVEPRIDITATGTAAATGKGPFSSTLATTDPWANISY